MGLKVEKRIVDGLTFQVTEFPAWPALKLSMRLAKLAGPALAGALRSGIGAAGGGFKLRSLLDVDLAALLPAGLEVLTDRLDPEAFAALCADLLGSTQLLKEQSVVDLSSEDARNATFNGALPRLYKVLWIVLETNSFFGLGGIGKIASSQAIPPSPAP